MGYPHGEGSRAAGARYPAIRAASRGRTLIASGKMSAVPEIRLFEHAIDKAVAIVSEETGIIEVVSEGGRVGRYLRTDGFDAEGRRRYGLVDTVAEATVGCPTCRAPWDLYGHGLGTELAGDYERHSLLLRCDDCGALFECYPEGRAQPERLSPDLARSRFPGAL